MGSLIICFAVKISIRVNQVCFSHFHVNIIKIFNATYCTCCRTYPKTDTTTYSLAQGNPYGYKR